MGITSVKAGNFKGINGLRNIKIKPITLFLGANSSGKSTCIHALSALAQSFKITNNPSHLILDDDFSDVHLGRFADVSHARNYRDPITLGFSMDDINTIVAEIKPDKKLGFKEEKNITVDVEYSFKAKQKTQEPYLYSAKFRIGQNNYEINKKKDDYFLKNLSNGQIVKCNIDSSLKIDMSSIIMNSNKEINVHFENFLALTSVQENIISEMSKTLYLGPFRQAPMRLYRTRGSNPKEVGSLGEGAIAMLANEELRSQERPHLKQIAKWLNELQLAKNISIARVGASDLFDVNLEIETNKKLPIADLGYGLSQVLPVLTQCSFAPKESTLLFEQPEIHLHSIAGRSLASVFIETAKRTKGTILIETHSPDMFKEFLRKMRAGEWAVENFICYRVSRIDGESLIEEIDIDPNDCDVYENWEHGISVI